MANNDKWTNPREAALDVVRDLIEEKKQTIESGPLEGTEIVTIEDISEAFRTPLESVSDFTAEVRTPGLVYVAGVCPNCKQTANLRMDLSTELRIETGGRHLRLKGKSKEVTHYCGQTTLSDGDAVEGQVGAFDLGALSNEEAVVNSEALHDLLSLVEADFPADNPTVEEIDGWDEPTREIVRDWASAVYLQASDHDVEVPPLPEVLGGEATEVVEIEGDEEDQDGDGDSDSDNGEADDQPKPRRKR